MTIHKRTLLSSSLLLLLTGCAQNIPGYDKAVADIKTGKDTLKTPGKYSQSINSAKVNDGWIRTFKDKKLDRLVDEAQRNNPSLKIAASRVERAEALTQLTESNLMPTVNMRGYYRDNNAEGAQEIAFGGFGVSWEPDVWGRVGNLVAADRELTAAQLADYDFARQSLAANTARAWFLYNTNSRIYSFTKKIISLQEKTLKILEAREKIGQGNKRDVHLARALVASAKDSASAALSAKERSQRALEVLVGRYPSGKLSSGKLDTVLPRIPNGLPAQLLERRPDLIAAEQRVAAAFHQKASADLLHMPNIRLNLGLGPNSLNDAITSLAGGILAPVYTGGAIEAQVAVANAEQKEAIAQYAKTTLRAFQEVENALAGEKHLATRYKATQEMVKEYKAAYTMTVEKYRIGQSTVLDILIIQGKWISAEIQKLQVTKKRLINRVNLYLALGGSFDTKRMHYTAPKKAK
ncbi:TolC family protein [Sulfurovum sp. NBC37-1]|uniref:TolC family protein n=1 Tax=Sulfurovum sp. (strain NBC37-1) TaxID=387093 RepID=UPI0001587D7C|nr:TolC family protein [Sulfurovum sp. NBC37-1]BAF72935.1 outer membrane efflux lipoprotein [Sulfurovum sp. NBC37-1]